MAPAKLKEASPSKKAPWLAAHEIHDGVDPEAKAVP